MATPGVKTHSDSPSASIITSIKSPMKSDFLIILKPAVPPHIYSEGLLASLFFLVRAREKNIDFEKEKGQTKHWKQWAASERRTAPDG